jgi:FXSXX-COOH protein
MRDEHYGSGPLIDTRGISLEALAEVDSAALRAMLASSLTDQKEPVAAFSNTI